VTLLDFGCAALGASFYTHASLRYRTPPEARVEIPDGGIEQLAWSAPEVRAGAGWSDKSDVYSLGWLLYRLITGKLPTRPDSNEPVPVHKVAPACSAELARVVLQTLQPRPGDRPSAAQLVTAFEDMLEDEAPVEHAEEPSDRYSRPSASPVALPPQPAASAAAARTPHRRAGVLLAAVAGGLGASSYPAVAIIPG
jgi:serine/threonine protein kinase